MFNVIGNIIKTFLIFEIFLLISPNILTICAFITKRRHRYSILRRMSEYITILRRKFNNTLFKWIKSLFNNKFRGISKEALLIELTNDTPGNFEKFCGELYSRLGYKTKVMPEGPDGGKDVILVDKYGNITYIECKRYSPNSKFVVGREICQKLIGSCACDSVRYAKVFTTGKVCDTAYKYAEHLNKQNKFELEIVNYDKIYELYKKANPSIDKGNKNVLIKLKKVMIPILLVFSLGLVIEDSVNQNKNNDSFPTVNTHNYSNFKENTVVSFDDFNIKFNNITEHGDYIEIFYCIENNSKEKISLSNFEIYLLNSNKREVENNEIVHFMGVRPGTAADFKCKFKKEKLEDTPIKVIVEYSPDIGATKELKEAVLLD